MLKQDEWSIVEKGTRVEEGTPHSEWVVCSIGAGSIATVYGNDGDEALARALLIAAAPELLKACRETMACLQDIKQLQLPELDCGGYLETQYLDDAIAKAEGKTP